MKLRVWRMGGVCLTCLMATTVLAEDLTIRPVVPGEFTVKLQRRVETEPSSKTFRVVIEEKRWKVSETAIIICDMWDNHYCQSAAQRVKLMVPRMNGVLTAARNHGAQIRHSPSGTLH